MEYVEIHGELADPDGSTREAGTFRLDKDALMGFVLSQLHLTTFDNSDGGASVAGNVGRVSVVANLRWLGASLEGAIVVGDARGELRRRDDVLVGEIELRDPKLWWPHTHGEPALYPLQLEIGAQVIDLGKVGFRTIERRGEFELAVNGVPLGAKKTCPSCRRPAVLPACQVSAIRPTRMFRNGIATFASGAFVINAPMRNGSNNRFATGASDSIR